MRPTAPLFLAAVLALATGPAVAACDPTGEGGFLCRAPRLFPFGKPAGPEARRAVIQGLYGNAIARVTVVIEDPGVGTETRTVRLVRREPYETPVYGGVRTLALRDCAISFGGGFMQDRPCPQVLEAAEQAVSPPAGK